MISKPSSVLFITLTSEKLKLYLSLFHQSWWNVSDNLHLPHSLASNDDILGGSSYKVNLAWITLQVLRPACFGHVLAVLDRCSAKRLHAWLQSRLTSGLMGLSDTACQSHSVSASLTLGPSVSSNLTCHLSKSSTPHNWIPPFFLCIVFVTTLTCQGHFVFSNNCASTAATGS